MAILSIPLDELRTRTSLKWRQYPDDVLPMWVAEMDAPVQPVVKQAVDAALERGDTGYAWGRDYAAAFQGLARNRWGWEIADEQIVQAGDVMSNVAAVLRTVTRPGDGVLISPPVYPPFREVIALTGRRVVEAPLAPNGFVDPDAVEAAMRGPEHPTAYLFCSPQNPTGAVHTADELAEIVRLTNENNVALVVDEIHACLVDPGVDFTPMLTVPGAGRAIVCTSAGKAWNLAGFKAGLIVGGPDAALPALPSFDSGFLAGVAHTAAMREAPTWPDEVMAEVRANKRLLRDLLTLYLPQARYEPAEGTYLAWVECTALGCDNPAARFLETGRVAFIRGADFSADYARWVRINLATSPAIITEAVRRMAAACH